MFFVFYKITHKNFPNLIYIGSTENFHLRKTTHKNRFYDKTKSVYNLKLYTFIRENNIDFNELEFQILSQFNMKSKSHALKHERYWMEKYDSIKNGLNERIPYNPSSKQDYQIRNKDKINEKMMEKINCPICKKIM